MGRPSSFRVAAGVERRSRKQTTLEAPGLAPALHAGSTSEERVSFGAERARIC